MPCAFQHLSAGVFTQVFTRLESELPWRNVTCCGDVPVPLAPYLLTLSSRNCYLQAIHEAWRSVWCFEHW